MYWESATAGVEETPTQFRDRLERNIQSALSDMRQEVDEHKMELQGIKHHLEGISNSLNSTTEILSAFLGMVRDMTASDNGNILERAYMLAVMQERQEMKQQLEELQALAATLKKDE